MTFGDIQNKFVVYHQSTIFGEILRTQAIDSQDQAKAFWTIQDKFADLYSSRKKLDKTRKFFRNFQKIPDYKQVKNGAVAQSSEFSGLPEQVCSVLTSESKVHSLQFFNARYTSGVKSVHLELFSGEALQRSIRVQKSSLTDTSSC